MPRSAASNAFDLSSATAAAAAAAAALVLFAFRERGTPGGGVPRPSTAALSCAMRFSMVVRCRVPAGNSSIARLQELSALVRSPCLSADLGALGEAPQPLRGVGGGARSSGRREDPEQGPRRTRRIEGLPAPASSIERRLRRRRVARWIQLGEGFGRRAGDADRGQVDRERHPRPERALHASQRPKTTMSTPIGAAVISRKGAANVTATRKPMPSASPKAEVCAAPEACPPAEWLTAASTPGKYPIAEASVRSRATARIWKRRPPIPPEAFADSGLGDHPRNCDRRQGELHLGQPYEDRVSDAASQRRGPSERGRLAQRGGRLAARERARNFVAARGAHDLALPLVVLLTEGSPADGAWNRARPRSGRIFRAVEAKLCRGLIHVPRPLVSGSGCMLPHRGDAAHAPLVRPTATGRTWNPPGSNSR